MKEKIQRITRCFYIKDNLYCDLHSREAETWIRAPEHIREEARKKVDNDIRKEYTFVTTSKQTIMVRKKKLIMDFSSFIVWPCRGKTIDKNYGILKSIEIDMERYEEADMGIRIMFNTTGMSFSLIHSHRGMFEVYIESNQLTTRFYA